MKILLTTLLCLALCLPVFADQQTTVLRQETSIGKAQAVLPYIDGSNSVDLEKKANGLIFAAAQELSRQVGGGSIDYEVTLNRPSLVSVLLTARNGGKMAYRGLNLDLTTGAEFGVTDFFINNDTVKDALHGYDDVLFTENGLLCSRGKYASYDALAVSYSQVLPFVRIGEAGRIMQVARLTASATKKTLVMEKSGLIALKLDANPSSGYGWVMSASSSNVQKVGSSFTIPRAEEERVGTPGVEIVFLYVEQPGTYNIKMEYKRPWEKLSLDSFSFTVIVQGA